MSRNLPPRPNLEYLKKEAKDRLDDLRRTDSAAQLADAQFALARDYGFDSWPRLKAHVDSILAVAPERPLVGAWVANVAKSKRHPANPFKSARLHIAIRGNSVEIRDEFVDQTGKAVRGRNHLEVDGLERDFGNGYFVSATWLTNGLEAVTMQDGRMIARATYTVSSDGRTLTISDHNGESNIVLDRLIQ